ncbi:MAG: glycoside hydrolase family 9 protein [Spirochaetales bacterium]|nr:glycoside hydrolase family 9 protein [Spirochaetales bacterium]
MAKKHVVNLLIFLLSILITCSLPKDPPDPDPGLEANQHIRIDQFGYRTEAQKIAVIVCPQTGFNGPDTYYPGTTFEVRHAATGEVEYSSSITVFDDGNIHTQSGDKVWWFEFSSVSTPGTYYIHDPANDESSYEFDIGDDVYNDVLKHAMRAFFYQRCGFEKSAFFAGDWPDGASHVGSLQDTQCRLVTDTGNESLEKDLSGGWYDAGDYNKYVNFTFAAVHDLLSAYRENPSVFKDDYAIPESDNGIPDILDEIKWELDWLVKMQESDDSVLMKVSGEGYEAKSPPGADTVARRYGPSGASSTNAFSGMLAHAYLIFKDIAGMGAYAGDLLARAENAWTSLETNGYPFSSYDNAGFSSANPERSEAEQKAMYVTAAVYLYAATGEEKYKTFIENNYTTYVPYPFNYWWNAYDSVHEDALLYYASLAGASPSVKSNINTTCINEITGSDEFLPAVTGNTDAYRAYLNDGDYGWGSNREKCHTGLILYNMVTYGIDSTNETDYRKGAEDYLHYMHGVNAINMAMLTNMYDFGGDNCADEIYHSWFHDGTAYDNAKTSPYGPPPGYVPGGVNKYYAPDASYIGPALEPPLNQPVQKAYRDWNTSYPENSWEVTEPGIYYQAAYVKLLSKFASDTP